MKRIKGWWVDAGLLSERFDTLQQARAYAQTYGAKRIEAIFN